MWVSEFEQNIPEANGIAKLRLAARASCVGAWVSGWHDYVLVDVLAVSSKA